MLDYRCALLLGCVRGHIWWLTRQVLSLIMTQSSILTVQGDPIVWLGECPWAWDPKGFSIQSTHSGWCLGWIKCKAPLLPWKHRADAFADTLGQVWPWSRASSLRFCQYPLLHLVGIEGAPFLVSERKPHFTPLYNCKCRKTINKWGWISSPWLTGEGREWCNYPGAVGIH